MHPFKVFRYFLDGLVVNLGQLAIVKVGNPVPEVVIIIHQQAPNPLNPLVGTVQPFFIPRHGFGQWPHEHFVEPERVGTVLINDVIRVNHVPLGLRHLFVVGTQDHPLVNQLHERFLGWY